MSDTDLKTAVADAGLSPQVADAVLKENADARLSALQDAMAAVALICLLALFFTQWIPAIPVGTQDDGGDVDAHARGGTAGGSASAGLRSG
jgi:hypothetical protein